MNMKHSSLKHATLKRSLLATLIVLSLPSALALDAEVTRVADNEVLVSWDAASGPVDVMQYFRTGPQRDVRQAISASDADGEHLHTAEGDVRPYFVLRTADGQEHEVAERLLPLEGGNNFRDLGGYATQDGKRVKWGTLYRSGTMVDLTDADYRYLGQLGIAVVCDLRSTEERHNEPTQWQAATPPQRLERDYELEVGDLYAALLKPGITVDEVKAVFADFMREVPGQFASDYRDMFAALVAGKAPLAFNCSAGKDRTGAAAALLLTALGVDRETVIADYLLSNQYYKPRPSSAAAGDDATSQMLAALPQELLAVLMGVDRMYLEATFEAIEERHGSVETYLDEVLGVDAAALASLRAQYTE